jgi:DUF4097 and DUF4098 domain-containing protein YvlB
VAVTGAVVASGLILAGCGLGNVVGPESEAKVAYDVSARVLSLDVESGSGDIVVVESGRSGVHVTETLHWRGNASAKPTTSHPVDGDKLTLNYRCPKSSWSCGVDYRVEIPHGLDVKSDTGSGDITLRALSGPVNASTGSGDIDANGLSGTTLIGKTGSGDVQVAFVAIPSDVNVDTGSGNGTVKVPQGSYAVTTDSGSGSQQVGVTKNAAAPRKIVVRTGSGDVKVLPAVASSS